MGKTGLEGIIKSMKNFGRAALLAGSMLVSGCIGVGTYLPQYNSQSSHRVYPEVGIRAGLIGLCGLDFNAGETLHYIPIHPEDGGASRGGVHTEFEGAGCMFLSGGLECSIGTKKTRLAGGIDFRYGGSCNETQEMQPLPFPYQSYGWTKESMDTPYMPFMEFNHRVSRHASIGIEVGFPYAEVEASAGHYRYCQKETIMRGTWEGFGIRCALNLDFFEKCWSGSREEIIGFSVIYEKFEPKFGSVDGGKIEMIGLYLRFPLNF